MTLPDATVYFHETNATARTLAESVATIMAPRTVVLVPCDTAAGPFLQIHHRRATKEAVHDAVETAARRRGLATAGWLGEHRCCHAVGIALTAGGEVSFEYAGRPLVSMPAEILQSASEHDVATAFCCPPCWSALRGLADTVDLLLLKHSNSRMLHAHAAYLGHRALSPTALVAIDQPEAGLLGVEPAWMTASEWAKKLAAPAADSVRRTLFV